MKIEKITLCNLASLEGEQVIDFTAEPLASASLFAITGDTGAGKSTILDAICLALYGQAPRFEGRENLTTEAKEAVAEMGGAAEVQDARAILRRGAKEGFAKVTFAVGNRDRYEATWSVRVKRSKKGTFDSAVRTFEQIAPRRERFDGKDVKAMVEQVVGLTYEQFTRTVILAQNSFATFLRASRRDKSALLEKITGTAIYAEISKKIHEKHAAAEAAAEAVAHKMEGLLRDHLLPEELAALESEQRLLAANASTLDERSAGVERQLQWIADNAAALAALSAAEAAHVEANKAYVSARADEQALERYDSVQSVQPLYQEAAVRERDIAASRDQENQLQGQIAEQRQRVEGLVAALERAQTKQMDTEVTFHKQRPIISRGQVLCGEINEAQGAVSRAQERKESSRRTVEQRQQGVAESNERLAQTQAQLEKARAQEQTLGAHRQMFEKFDLVKDKLAALTEESRRNVALHKRFSELQREQGELHTNVDRLEHTLQEMRGALGTKQSELERHKMSIAGNQGDFLQRRFSDTQRRQERLRQAAALWNRLSNGYEELSEKRAEVTRLSNRITQLRADEKLAATATAAAEDAFQRIQTAYTLSFSQDINALRKQLKEGVPCPVCGSAHHPYHTETERAAGELLQNLEKEHAELGDKLKAARARQSDIVEHLRSNEGLLSANRNNLDSLERQQQAAVEEWGAVADLDPSFADCSATVARDARKTMVELLIAGAERTLEEARTELDNFNIHQGHINRLNEEISKLEGEMTDVRKQLASAQTNYNIALAKLAETKDAMALSDRQFSSNFQDLDSMVTLSGWFTEWNKNSEAFRTRLNDLNLSWQQNAQLIEQLTRAEVLIGGEVKQAERSQREAELHAQQADEAYAAALQKLEEKRAQLAELFGDSTPDAEENRLQKAVEEARAETSAALAARQNAEASLSTLEGTFSNLVATRMDRKKDYAEQMLQIDRWIHRFNADHSPIQYAELTEIFADSRDWQTLRRRLDALKKALTLAETSLKQAREALLDVQRRPDQPDAEAGETSETLAHRLTELKTERAAVGEKQLQIAVRLRQHADAVSAAGRFEAELNAARTEAREWGELDSLLGSADGEKFRTIAQSYTFAVLVAHANAQLRAFSPRYALANIPRTLLLEVIDRDMFDTHRYVNSLSGGETFVVSLALALGLANLSAGSLQIGSLFIDEGFGNLDHESLELVMQALSGLENSQGRKVGVISHTDQIRDQIHPQIRVEKQASAGRSVIRIG